MCLSVEVSDCGVSVCLYFSVFLGVSMDLSVWEYL